MRVMPEIAAFLPMKGHSERVPGKNLRTLGGRPLYRWVADSLLKSGVVDRLVIDTDSLDIAKDAEKAYGDDIEVTWRPEALRGDFVPMHAILRHDVSLVEENLFIQTHSTNPFLRPTTIANAVAALLASEEHDSLFTVTGRKSRFYWADGHPINHDPAELLRTQDLDPVFEENSNLYVFSRETIEETGKRIGLHPLMFEMDPTESLDIDEESDFVVAEALAPHILGEDGV